MKNKYLSYWLLLLLTGLWSCKEDDGVFEQTADERISATLSSYQKELAEAPYGWKGIIYPGGGGVYSFYFKFNDKNRVVMYSDFAPESAATAKESSYRLKAMQTPSLIFDTYSYLHVLADPDGGVNGGNDGEGLKSDYEFSFEKDTLNSGRITLTGTKNQSKLVLIKATQEEATAYGNGGLAKSLLFSNISKYLTYFKRVTIGAVTYEIAVNQNARKITLNWLDGTTLKSFTTEYYYSSTGVAFITPFVNGSQTINGFTDLTWDASKLSLGVTVAGSKVTVVDAAKPLKVDVAAARRWYQTALSEDSYWLSVDGFHVNGVDDAFKVNSLTRGEGTYYFYIYYPQFGSNYDAFAPVFFQNNGVSLYYWDAVNAPTFATDGRIIFTPLGILGDGYPADGPVIASRNYLYDESGYYLIQLSENSYDMVNAKDAKGWIRWQR
ncbi:DUF4302 domain-containing protein [Dyadobacter sp. LHD-138]|uniref:DUF4302 domain-containing protein n=1 Tax=Dyadobacter sp. LHD-138 TaxID=3071413 RepID=UPI0027DF87B5|nr:DUF4302 domain-containing protein [Dyadobacter sp. LHD-138]MDQ6478370.1 DUF4302 domain-containing protein [Dyadobacter sp. LHD-138]